MAFIFQAYHQTSRDVRSVSRKTSSAREGKLAVTSKKVPQGGKDFVDVTAAGTFTAKVCR